MYPSNEQVNLAFNIVMMCPPEGFDTIDPETYSAANEVLRTALQHPDAQTNKAPISVE